jgi:DNA-binding transcriptional LysR family regulator
MDRLKVIESFVAVATKGSLTAAAKVEGVAAVVVGRRIDALEERLGVKLFTRTTRRITLTQEGGSFLEDCQRLLADLVTAEANVSAGSVRVTGALRITAPAGFGRRHVAPLVPAFAAQHPKLQVSLNLSDRLVDLPHEGFDCAIRVGDLPDSNLVCVRLADNRRLCVASPGYLERAGTPKTPQDLARHECLVLSSQASQTKGWAFAKDGAVVHVRPTGRLDCSDGQVLHQWCLAGLGLAWRSLWEVSEDVAAGRLVSVLDDCAAPPDGIFAVFAQRKHQPLRLRLWVDFLKQAWGQPAYWPDLQQTQKEPRRESKKESGKDKEAPKEAPKEPDAMSVATDPGAQRAVDAVSATDLTSPVGGGTR